MADRLSGLVDVQVVSAGVALVTLNLPRLRNAMTTEMTSAWTEATDKIAADRSLPCSRPSRTHRRAGYPPAMVGPVGMVVN